MTNTRYLEDLEELEGNMKRNPKEDSKGDVKTLQKTALLMLLPQPGRGQRFSGRGFFNT